ncbi:MAG: hypothetical protein KA354_17775 [Phycisphaerae bacterium]|nr:hypothetical protein [Phycisphaerae bacterium]
MRRGTSGGSVLRPNPNYDPARTPRIGDPGYWPSLSRGGHLDRPAYHGPRPTVVHHGHRPPPCGFGFYRSRHYCPVYYTRFFAYPLASYYVTSPTIVQETVVVPQPVYYQQPAYTTGYAASTLYSTSPTMPSSDATSPYTSEPSPQPTTASPTDSGTTSPTPAAENITGLAGQPAPDTERVDPKGEELYTLMFEGTKAFAEGEYDAAARMFLQVTMQDPENADAALAYAVARIATGDYAISAIAIRRGVRQFKEVVNSGFDIRERYTNKEDFDRHFRLLVNFVSQRPDNADGLVSLGFAQHFTGQRDQAVETFKDIKQRFPSDADLAEVFIKAKPLAEIQQQEAAEQGAGQPSQTEPSGQTGQSLPSQPPTAPTPALPPTPKEVKPVPPQQQWVPLVPKSPATPSSGTQPNASTPTTARPSDTPQTPAKSNITTEPVTPDLFDLDS